MAAVKAEARGRVVAVADAQAPAAQALAGAFGGDVTVFTGYQRPLAEARPDVVITCLWTPPKIVERPENHMCGVTDNPFRTLLRQGAFAGTKGA